MFTETQLTAMRKIVFEQFTSPRGPAEQQRADLFLKEQVLTSAAYPSVSLNESDVWGERDSRSHERFLHAFLFFMDWFGTVLAGERTKVEACRAAMRIIESWSAVNGKYPGGSPMAYHDETTAQRLIILLRLQPILAENVDPDSLEFVRRLMDETAVLLTDSAFHSPGNNHGMFQDLALLYYSILGDWIEDATRETFMQLAFSRLDEYFSSCFTAEGVHIENTPTYHIMVCRYVSVVQRLAASIEHKNAEKFGTLLSKAETYATHALMPNGLYPPISDTAQRPVNTRAFLRTFPSKEFLYAASGGRQGSPPKERFLVLPQTGYLIYRSAWNDRNATYAFFSAAYNSGYHKHSDDLSLFLRSGDMDLLAESGPYSYDYKDPLSRYAYSQFSHNSLVVDGRSLPRTDDRSASVNLVVEEQTCSRVLVEGTNARYKDTKHTRQLEIDESSGSPRINLVDTVTSGGEHTYQLLWNLGAHVTAVVHGQGFELFNGEKKVMDLIFRANVPTRLTVHKGRLKPRPLGWTFPNFGEAVPSSVVSIEFSGKSAEIQSSIRLAEFSYTDRGIFYKDGWRRYQGAVLLNYLFQPAANGTTERLVVCFTAIHGAGDFTYNYKSTIDQTDTAALYILDDFGDQGAYYYSDHESTGIFDSVQNLIKKIMAEHGLDATKVATAGSSKGGSGALIHGLALGVDRIIVGAPQTRIGSFLSGPHPNILEFMTGGTTPDDISRLNSIIPGLMRNASSTTTIFVVVGEADHHYKKHVVPLIADAEEHGIAVSPLLLPGIAHADIGKIFRLYLRAHIDQWVDRSNETVLPYKLYHSAVGNKLTIEIFSASGSKHAFRLYRDSKVVEQTAYSTERKAVFHNILPGTYRIRVSSRIVRSSTSSAFTTRRLVIPEMSSGSPIEMPLSETTYSCLGPLRNTTVVSRFQALIRIKRTKVTRFLLQAKRRAVTTVPLYLRNLLATARKRLRFVPRAGRELIGRRTNQDGQN
ncbi:heparinase II/III domain-containing protein [Arthrobacter sp. 7Tela_A1]|uniref:heparinase II/III domain-containing protein n=1 Tax=Arthrobacter sp. 7Tela_A1 TaxID=3093745 RepID=UPI003BB6D23E